MSTQHHNVIFLFISSSGDSVYQKMRDVIQVLFDKHNIKYFFVEYRPTQTQLISEENNYIYVKGEETFIPGMYMKIMLALNHIADNYSYDYVVRANLSTFWNLPNLFDFLSRQPKTGVAAGFDTIGFLSGTGIILSRDVGILLHTNIIELDYNDDVAISHILRMLNIHLHNINDYKWGYLIDCRYSVPSASNCRWLDIHEDDFSDILSFRIKHADRNKDIECMKVLLKKLYNIEVDIA